MNPTTASTIPGVRAAEGSAGHPAHTTGRQHHGEPARTPSTPPGSRWQGWLPLIVLPILVLVATPATVPRWAFMWTLAVAIFCGCKWLTWRRTPAPVGTRAWQRAAYLLAWPGLDADAFLRPPDPTRVCPPAAGEWVAAATRTALGAALLFGGARAVPASNDLLFGWVGMVGLILLLHFGSFALLSCFWRAVGIVAQPLMDQPSRSGSVAEFWGRRWNTAFRTLTHRFLFRPLTARLGARWAVAAGFGFSGLLHEMVISVPARGGYGGPTLFFVLQAAAILAERSPAGRRLGLGRGGWRGWFFTMLALVLPAGLLFHPPFVCAVIVPFLAALGVHPRAL